MFYGTRRRFLSLLGPAAIAGCTTPRQSGQTPVPSPVPSSFTPRPINWESPTTSPLVDVSATVLIENLEVPWDITFAPTGDAFISERVGRISRYTADALETVVRPEDAIDAGSIPPGSDEQPWWVDGGEGGTLGIAVHPDYPDPSFVYVYYTANTSRGKQNRVARFDATASDPAGTQTQILDGVPASKIHNGGRIDFGPGGYLWVTTGDAGTERSAQQPAALAGKILRITPAGRPAPTNPELSGTADPRVYTLGHRNPQGLAWLPNGTPVITEHGPTGRDEVNRLVPGANYGWPDVRTADDYRSRTDIHPPLLNTGAGTWAPSGCVFYTGDTIPEWHNRMLVGTLAGQQVKIITLTPPGGTPPPLDGQSTRFSAAWLDDVFVATAHSVLRNELGRVRHVTTGPGGTIYAITSNRDGRAGEGFPTERDDVLVRLEPA